MPQSWRLAMSTFTRRQFNRTLMASVGSVWARDVVGNRASQANQQQTWAGSIADVPGIKAGHYTDSRRPTGCTALLFEGKGTAGVDYDGSAPGSHLGVLLQPVSPIDRKSTRLNSSHTVISYAVFCLKKKKKHNRHKSDDEVMRTEYHNQSVLVIGCRILRQRDDICRTGVSPTIKS